MSKYGGAPLAKDSAAYKCLSARGIPAEYAATACEEEEKRNIIDDRGVGAHRREEFKLGSCKTRQYRKDDRKARRGYKMKKYGHNERTAKVREGERISRHIQEERLRMKDKVG
jgi:hypothetical protein